MASAADKKPLLLMTAFPAAGHTAPLLRIAAHLIQRGYEVVFVASKEFEPKITALGAEFIDTPGIFDLVPGDWFQEREKYEMGLPRVIFDQKSIFLSGMPKKAQVIGDALEKLAERYPGRQIIIVGETCNQGVLPFKYGRPLPKGFAEFPKTIGVNVIPLFIQSEDVGPFLTGLPPDSTESGKLRNKLLNKTLNATAHVPLNEEQIKRMKEAGCTSLPTEEFSLDSWILSWDTTFQVCSPSLEYIRSDQPAHVKAIGCLPLDKLKADWQPPAWWSDVTSAKSQGKKVVFVAQGTVATNHSELLIPTITGLAGRDDVLVVATLGVKDAKLPEDVVVAPNVRVDDYLLYDAILPYTDVFVSNAGYGALTQCVMSGVPLVVAGETEDKKEVSMRAERAGIAHNLKTQLPTPEQVAKGVDDVLSNPAYKQKVLEIQKENEGLDAFGTIEKQVEAYTA